jgi:hypothetical protein
VENACEAAPQTARKSTAGPTLCSNTVLENVTHQYVQILALQDVQQPMVEVARHSTSDASALAALLIAHLCPISSLFAPCDPGAALRALRHVSPLRDTRRS